ncbi:hypothetical protein [Cupriavidus consociatus]|uniref:hypothetical protein n=1 Tax=Cupriavidus consociatus TaxID=2821357 RepID=UPI001AE8531B|nr:MULTISPECIES: hypothetical protein [unclassified Cupriavidus]MBP0625268.1 hypothetical protein [Cupriavidus sp. LEh25]MDK2662002.1 hypothetical protein [Cupriavidus sp. LEh21]
MALTVKHISAITELILTEPTLSEAAAKWRKRFPDVRLMRINASELRHENPALEFGGRRVYFAISTGACVSITAQACEANMLIFSEDQIYDEE